jgi:hypothetical protein
MFYRDGSIVGETGGSPDGTYFKKDVAEVSNVIEGEEGVKHIGEDAQ